MAIVGQNKHDMILVTMQWFTLFGGGWGGVLMMCRILSGFHRLEQFQLASVHLHGGGKKLNFYA
jgi:hypothetical protein